jgi:hypothetical protein
VHDFDWWQQGIEAGSDPLPVHAMALASAPQRLYPAPQHVTAKRSQPHRIARNRRFSDRFDREVRAVAALNHPNVCHIYDVGPNFTFQDPSSLWLTQSANGALVYQCTDHQDSGQLDL